MAYERKESRGGKRGFSRPRGGRSTERSFNPDSERGSNNREERIPRSFENANKREFKPRSSNEGRSGYPGNRGYGSREESSRSERPERSGGRPFQRKFTPKVAGSFDESYRKPEARFESREPRRFGGSSERGTSTQYGDRDNSREGGFSGRRFGGGNDRGYSRGGRGNFGSRSQGGQGGRFGGRRNRGNVQHIDESKFIQTVVKKTPEEKYVAKHAFTDFGFDRQLEANIEKKGYTAPTPIQDQSIMHIMNGEDLLGLANTGSGKTGAFLLPLIHKVNASKSSKVIVITPTRELALQIQQELFSLTKGMRIFSVTCIGGDSINRQLGDLRRGFNFVIGTPGRLNDLLERRAINLNQFDTVVLDEVDRMLDMGFADEIKEIIAQLPEDKQSLFFSATMDKRVEGIIHLLLKPGYPKVVIKQKSHAENVHQDVVYFSDYDERISKIKQMLDSDGFDKTLIFVNTKREVEKIDQLLYKEGYLVQSIHGDKSQYQRKKAIDAFKSGKATVLIATDVAARGLDISGISHVINYDIPNNHDDYIHRIGRTGRAENYGTALTFVRKGSR